jgi:hypothetical protein
LAGAGFSRFANEQQLFPQDRQLTTLVNSGNHRTDLARRSAGYSEKSDQFFSGQPLKAFGDIVEIDRAARSN